MGFFATTKAHANDCMSYAMRSIGSRGGNGDGDGDGDGDGNWRVSSQQLNLKTHDN